MDENFLTTYQSDFDDRYFGSEIGDLQKRNGRKIKVAMALILGTTLSPHSKHIKHSDIRTNNNSYYYLGASGDMKMEHYLSTPSHPPVWHLRLLSNNYPVLLNTLQYSTWLKNQKKRSY